MDTLGAVVFGALVVTMLSALVLVVGATAYDIVQDIDRWLRKRAVNRERAARRKPN